MRPTRVIIVDGSLCLRQILSDGLSKDQRFDVVGHCGCGEDAIRLTRNLQPDVLVMEIELPGMSGIDALRSIRAEGLSKVILLSRGGRALPRDRAYGQMLGAAAVFTKPEAEHLSDLFNLAGDLLAAVYAAGPQEETSATDHTSGCKSKSPVQRTSGFLGRAEPLHVA